MLLRDTLSMAIKGITTNKSRTFLTTLGIIIGVASVVLMVSIGRSFQNYILTQIESVGTNTLDIIPTGFEKFGGNLETNLQAVRIGGNTFVIFTADNGYSPSGMSRAAQQKAGHNSSHTFRGAKADIWEGGHRVLEPADAAQQPLPQLGGVSRTELLDVRVPGFGGGVHRHRLLPCEAVDHAGEPLGVEREVGDDVAARPARQARRLGELIVREPVHGADQPLVRSGEVLERVGSLRPVTGVIAHGHIQAPAAGTGSPT